MLEDAQLTDRAYSIQPDVRDINQTYFIIEEVFDDVLTFFIRFDSSKYFAIYIFQNILSRLYVIYIPRFGKS